MSREADRKAQRAMFTWGAAAIVGEVTAFTSTDAQTWLRIVVGVLSLMCAFIAGLVAIPSENNR